MLKCVLIGEPSCGKSSLIQTFMKGYFDKQPGQCASTTYEVNFIYAPRSSTRSVTAPYSFNFKLYDYKLTEPDYEQNLMTKELDKIGLFTF